MPEGGGRGLRMPPVGAGLPPSRNDPAPARPAALPGATLDRPLILIVDGIRTPGAPDGGGGVHAVPEGPADGAESLAGAIPEPSLTLSLGAGAGALGPGPSAGVGAGPTRPSSSASFFGATFTSLSFLTPKLAEGGGAAGASGGSAGTCAGRRQEVALGRVPPSQRVPRGQEGVRAIAVTKSHFDHASHVPPCLEGGV